MLLSILSYVDFTLFVLLLITVWYIFSQIRFSDKMETHSTHISVVPAISFILIVVKTTSLPKEINFAKVAATEWLLYCRCKNFAGREIYDNWRVCSFQFQKQRLKLQCCYNKFHWLQYYVRLIRFDTYFK